MTVEEYAKSVVDIENLLEKIKAADLDHDIEKIKKA